MSFWPEKLREHHPEFSTAIVELRGILFRGLKASLSGRQNTDDAFLEDITQKTLLKILAQLDSFQGTGKFTSWALAIAIRTAFNELRRRDWNHVSLEELRQQQGGLIEEIDRSASPASNAEQHDLSELLRDIIRTDLTPRQQEVLFAELSGMPQEEIARQLKTNRNNVYKLFHDGRKALKRALELRGFDKESLLTHAQSNDYGQGVSP